MPHDEDAFPELRYTELKLQAKALMKDYPTVSIEKIILYRYRPRSRLAVHPVKYAMVFEVNTPESVFKTFCRDSAMEPCDFCFQEIRAIMSFGKYEDFCSATGRFRTVQDKAHDTTLMAADFTRVYKENPTSDFRNEWTFIVKAPGQELSERVRVDEPHWTIFEMDAKDPGHPERARVFATDLWTKYEWIFTSHVAALYLFANPDCTCKVKTVQRWISQAHPNPSKQQRQRLSDRRRVAYFSRLLKALNEYQGHRFSFESPADLDQALARP